MQYRYNGNYGNKINNNIITRGVETVAFAFSLLSGYNQILIGLNVGWLDKCYFCASPYFKIKNIQHRS